MGFDLSVNRAATSPFSHIRLRPRFARQREKGNAPCIPGRAAPRLSACAALASAAHLRARHQDRRERRIPEETPWRPRGSTAISIPRWAEPAPRCCPISTTTGKSRWSAARSTASTSTPIRPTCRSRAAPTGGRPMASPAAISRWCSAARSTSSARATRSATSSTARRRCSIPIWRPASARRSTTGSRPNGWRRIRGSRASIVVPMQAPDLAVEEIERRAGDNRFVSVLVLAQGETLLGTPALLAGLAGRGETQAAGRDPCRQRLSRRAEFDRLAVLSLRILSRRSAGVPGPDPEPDL